MVTQASAPAPILDEDLRRHFKVNFQLSPALIKRNSYFQDYICSRLFNAQTFQLNLANLADDEGKKNVPLFSD